MLKVNQEQVLKWIRLHLGSENDVTPNRNGDNRGPDMHLIHSNKMIFIEAIGYTPGSGKNQSDLWKAFFQAVARLDDNSQWGSTDKVAIALPTDYLSGWQQRVQNVGRKSWFRIGDVFPELEIWFVADKNLYQYHWNEAFSVTKDTKV